MLYPTLSEIRTTRTLIDVFKGYNHNLRIGDGEFYDMKNLCSDSFPVLSSRSKRGIYAAPAAPGGMIAKDSLCYVDGGDFVINEDRYPMDLTEGTKSLTSMGAYVIIMPDKKYINVEDPSDRGSMEESHEAKYGDKSFGVCSEKGGFAKCYKGEECPDVDEMKTSALDLIYWIDTSENPNVCRSYSFTTEKWSVEDGMYVRISGDFYDFSLSAGDRIYIEGIEAEGFECLNGFATVCHAFGPHIIVKAMPTNFVGSQEKPIKISKKIPEMDFVIEAGNRLWGCRYGKALNGQNVNEIYASKLGDFKKWETFAGISTDSYAASVGTEGKFTGAITYLGYPLFFKENYIHKVYGNVPANYQIQTIPCRGVQEGSEKSLSIVNEVLFYKSRTGVCAYDGSLPVEISSALGDVAYYNAVAGTLGNKYYISMSDKDEEWSLFAYDTQKGLWHKEDGTRAVDFCNCRGELYYIDYGSRQIKTVKGSGVWETNPVEFEAVTGIIGTESPYKKYISGLDVRMLLSVGSRVSFFIEYDSSGEWEFLFNMDGIRLKSFSVPIKPRQSDHLRLKIIGRGDIKIFSICKTVEDGSEC